MLMIHNFSRSLRCASCKIPLISFSDSQLTNYIENTANQCLACNNQIDILDTIALSIEENFFFNDVYAFVGAKMCIGEFHLIKNTPLTLNFEDFDVPKGARILSINYTPQGSLFPLELQGNSPSRKMPKDGITLFPAAIMGEEGEDRVKCTIMLTWIEEGSLEEDSLLSLVDAFEEYCNDELEACIVPANTSIEFDVMQFLKSSLEENFSKTTVKDFLSCGISYVPSLKIMIPLIAKTKRSSAMPGNLLTGLTLLASWRNQIAHSGKTKQPLTKKEVATSLACVIIGKWYIRSLRSAA